MTLKPFVGGGQLRHQKLTMSTSSTRSGVSGSGSSSGSGTSGRQPGRSSWSSPPHLDRPDGAAGVDWCVCRVRVDRHGVLLDGRDGGTVGGPLGALTYRQSTFIVGLLSLVFAGLFIAHEISIEGGFDVRNYVAIAFSVVWIIVDLLLFVGAQLRASFLLLPWMALMVALTPIFFVAIVVGSTFIHSCARHGETEACIHEYHVFGTISHPIACVKLIVLATMLVVNTVSGYFVYQFYRFLVAISAPQPTSPLSSSGQSTANTATRPTHRLSSYAIIGGSGNHVTGHKSCVLRKSDSCDSQLCLPLFDNNNGGGVSGVSSSCAATVSTSPSEGGINDSYSYDDDELFTSDGVVDRSTAYDRRLTS